jgi:hypothetical protein
VRASLEPVLAALVTLAGMALTSAGAFVHAAPAVAPGALLILVGGAWLGNALARRDVRLLPGSQIVPHTTPEDG